ncbi:MAG: hypothetical protein Kow0059_21220 [Candidatus Sumerlaeia bacterium]
MRLWSLHPRYLDTRGLVALWREGLLAKAVLEGKTRGYRAHPQLRRFRQAGDPVGAISAYLWAVFEEGRARGYRFDAGKLNPAAGAAESKAGTTAVPDAASPAPTGPSALLASCRPAAASSPAAGGLAGTVRAASPIEVTDGQILYEWRHLLSKLRVRDPERFELLRGVERPDPHPLMRVVPGPIEAWEIVR